MSFRQTCLNFRLRLQGTGPVFAALAVKSEECGTAEGDLRSSGGRRFRTLRLTPMGGRSNSSILAARRYAFQSQSQGATFRPIARTTFFAL